eukprot:m51a1_g6427 hypothetical protein (435) ;mRNA; r:325773-331602
MELERERVASRLRAAGLSLRRDWLQACLDSYHRAPSPSPGAAADAVAWAYAQALHADLARVAEPTLPAGAGDPTVEHVVLPGVHVLQVEDLRDISQPLHDHRREDAAATAVAPGSSIGSPAEQQQQGQGQGQQPGHCRTMKLALSDGTTRVYALERQRVPTLGPDTPLGAKIALRGVVVKRGLLMLDAENAVVLGGRVDELVDRAAADRAAAPKSRRPALLAPDSQGQDPPKPPPPRFDAGPQEIVVAATQQRADYSFSDVSMATVQSDSRPPSPPLALQAVQAYQAPQVAPAAQAGALQVVQLCEAMQRVARGERALVRVACTGVESAFSVSRTGFSLCVRVDDGTCSVVCGLCSALIESVMQLSPERYIANDKGGEAGMQENAAAEARMEPWLAEVEGNMVLEPGDKYGGTHEIRKAITIDVASAPEASPLH